MNTCVSTNYSDDIQVFCEMGITLAMLKQTCTDSMLLPKEEQLLHDNSGDYDFNNECDMIYRIALGMTAKMYVISNDISLKEKSIRPYLTEQELELIEWLQILDVGMISGRAAYGARKNALTVAALEKFTITTLKAIIRRFDLSDEEISALLYPIT